MPASSIPGSHPTATATVSIGEKFYATGALFAHYIPIAATDANGNAHIAIAPRATPRD